MVEVQTRYMTVWVMTPAGIPVPTQVPYEYRIFHTKLVNRGLEVVIREELNKRPVETLRDLSRHLGRQTLPF